MGMYRLLSNKADVVKGLAKRCNENWAAAPKSDIVGLSFIVKMFYSEQYSGPVSFGYPSAYDLLLQKAY